MTSHIGSGRAKQLGSDAPLHQLAAVAAGSNTGDTYFVYNKPYYNTEQSFPKLSDDPIAITFSPDESMLAIVDLATNVEVYDTSDWSLITSVNMGVYTEVGGGEAIFSPNGDYLAVSAAENGDVIIYRTSDWSLEQGINTGKESPLCIDFSPDGSKIAIGKDEGDVDIYNTSDWSLNKTISEDQSDFPSAHSVCFSLDSSLIAHAADDTNVYINNVSDGSLAQTLSDLTGFAFDVEFSQKKDFFASSDGEELILYDTSDWSPVQTKKIEVGPDDYFTISFSPDGNLIAYGNGDNDGVDILKTSDLSIKDTITGVEGAKTQFSPKSF